MHFLYVFYVVATYHSKTILSNLMLKLFFKVELLDWNPEGGGVKLIGTLSKHGNTITDLSFHEQQTHIITTCSYDNNIHIWDIRYVKHTKILREGSMPTFRHLSF